jgi:eukaryotic-like serine/threonine-protein kinase
MPAHLSAPVNSRSAASAGPGPRPLSAQLPDYDLLAVIGRGTFADVWEVRDRRNGGTYALKQLRADRVDQPAARRILANEAEVARRISSEFVVRVFDPIPETSPPSILLEWLSGRTLASYLNDRPRLFCREALWIARQCAQGMHALLTAGYTHGDIKPSNIFMCDQGPVKLIDLGFARPDLLPARDLAQGAEAVVQGTPEYLAPEALLRGNSDGVARDVYSLGVVLYQMLTGYLPHQGDIVADVLRQHQQATPPRLRSLAPEAPREVEELVHRLLAKQPLRRGGGLDWLIGELIGLELLVLNPCG